MADEQTEFSQDDQKWLNTLKTEYRLGGLQDFTPEQIKKIDEKARTIYEKAGQDYVSFIQTAEKFDREPLETPEQELSLGQKLLGGVKGIPDTVKMIVENPLTASENMLRGYARTLNPAPLFGGDQVTLESMEALAAFPVVRGAEMFGRMFLDEDQRVPYTPLIQMIDEQEAFNRHLSAKTPGIQEGTEMASVAIGVGALAGSGVKGAKAVGKWAKEGGPKFVRQAIAKRKAAKAGKMGDALREDLEELSSAVRANGSLTDTIMNEPKKVESFLKNADEYAYQNFADELLEEFDGMEATLGKSVRKYKEAAYKDTDTLIEVPEEIMGLVQDIRARTTTQGKSVLPSKINKELERWEQIVGTGKMTPRDAMILDNLMVDIVKFGDEAKDIGKTVVKEVNPQLLKLRALNKNALRNASPDANAWTNADDKYSQFVARKQKLGNLVKNEKGVERLVGTILNDAKSRDRLNLEEMLNYANSLDPKMRGAQEFFGQVRQMRAARAMKDLKTRGNRPQQDLIEKFIAKHAEDAMVKREKMITFSAPIGGAILGGAVDALGGTGGFGATIGTIFGGFAKDAIVKGAARNAARAAEKMTDPSALLNRAKEINKLSKEARELAGDLSKIQKSFGSEGVISALDIVGATPFAIELMEYVQTQPKQKQEAQIKVPAKKTEPTLNINVDLGTIERRRQRQGVQ